MAAASESCAACVAAKHDPQTVQRPTLGKRRASVADGDFAVGTSTALAADGDYDAFSDEESDVELERLEFPPQEDCPMCMVPLSRNNNHTEYMTCCSKVLCRACSLGHAVTFLERGVKEDSFTRAASFVAAPARAATQPWWNSC